MRVKDLAPRSVVAVVSGDSLTAVAKALAEDEVGDVLVYGGGGPAGVFSERDLVRAVADRVDLDETTVDEYMTASVVSVDWESSINDGVSKMNDFGIRHLVVTKEGNVHGMISMRDLIGVFGTASPEL